MSPWTESVERNRREAVEAAKTASAQDYIARLPADWFKDASLETWFPLTAETLERLESELKSLGEECWKACLLEKKPPLHETYQYAIWDRCKLLQDECESLRAKLGNLTGYINRLIIILGCNEETDSTPEQKIDEMKSIIGEMHYAYQEKIRILEQRITHECTAGREWNAVLELQLKNTESILENLRTDFRCFIEQVEGHYVDAEAIKRAKEAIKP